MNRNIKIKRFLPFDIESVWDALTVSELLGSWFMSNDIMPVPGYEFTFRMAPQKGWDGITHCEILKVVPKEYISYTYKGFASGEKTLACAGIHNETADKIGKGIFASLDTVLSFTLEPTCGGTILTLKHSGFRGLKLIIVSYVMQMGWKKQLTKKLPKLLGSLKKS